MPSTDIDGSAVLILGHAQAMLILNMAQRAGPLSGPEQKVIDRIEKTFAFPSPTEVDGCELRLLYNIHRQAHEIGFVRPEKSVMVRLLVRVSDSRLPAAQDDLKQLTQLGECMMAWPAPHYYRLPDSPEVRAVIKRLEAISLPTFS